MGLKDIGDYFDFEHRDLWLAVAFAVLGGLASMRSTLLFLNKLTPIQGLLIYYGIVLIALLVLSKLGLAVFGIEIENVAQVIGTLMIFFSFFIIFNWTNSYVQYISTGSFVGIAPMFLQSEDGAVWYLWSLLLPATTAINIQILRVLTFIVTPFTLTFLGGMLIKGKTDLGGAFG